MKRANRNDRRGFTLAEVLLAVGILVVLFALAMIPITRMQKDLRQTELDGKAEIVFAAAQNRMTQLQAAGIKDLYQLDMADVSALGYKPLDSEEDETIKADTLCFVTSESRDDTSSAAYAILPEDQLEAGVRRVLDRGVQPRERQRLRGVLQRAGHHALGGGAGLLPHPQPPP